VKKLLCQTGAVKCVSKATSAYVVRIFWHAVAVADQQSLPSCCAAGADAFFVIHCYMKYQSV